MEIKQIMKEMTLREKIGQTAMPSPPALRKGVTSAGSYVEYFKQYPYGGFYVTSGMVKDDGSELKESHELAEIIESTAKDLTIPLFVAVDAEFGGGKLFKEMAMIPTNMAVGAANSAELAYKRAYYWAKELRAVGINWAFGPVCDILPNFFDPMGVRCVSDKTELVAEIIAHTIRGIRDAGMMSSAKHYPGKSGDYRDPHFSMCTDSITLEEWNRILKPIWEAAARADVASIMTAHTALPAIDDSIARGKTLRPASASSKVIGILRDDLGYDGIVITDAISMKGLAAAFEHEDIYIECFNAGNDIILFNGNDYIDVMEKAVADGRVSMERIDEAVERILRYKIAYGLFDGKILGEKMSEEDKQAQAQTSYEISKLGGTLVRNVEGTIPFDSSKVKKASIIVVSPSESFRESLKAMQAAFARYGVESEIVDTISSKSELEKISKDNELIVYACFVSWTEPYGLPGYSQVREINTLFNGLSYGAEKSVVASFASHTVYYNYFEGVDTFVNMYTSNKESMDAFVDGLFGKIAFTGKSPVDLKPQMS